MNKNIIRTSTLAVALLSLVSCSDDIDGHKEDVTLSPSFCYYFNPQSGQKVIMPPSTTRLTIDSRGKADAEIINFRRYPGSAPETITLPNLPWIASINGVTCIDKRDPQEPENQVHIERYMAYYADRRVDNKPAPISYTVAYLDDMTYIATFPAEEYAFGKTVTREANGGTEENENLEMYYHFTFDTQNMTVDMTMEKAFFGFGMPFPMTLTVPSIPLTLSAQGFSAELASVIPVSGGVPYPRFEIKDLKIEIPFIDNGSISFTCAGKWDVKAQVSTVPGKIR